MKGKSVTFRPRDDLRVRLDRLAEATERPLTFFLEKAIVAHLPSLEIKYAKEIAELEAREAEAAKATEKSPKPDPGRVQKRTYPHHKPQHYELNQEKKK